MAPQIYRTGSKRPWNADAADEHHSADTQSSDEDSGDMSLDQENANREMKEIKNTMQNCLDGVSSKADRDWAFGDVLPQAINPGLTLENSGIVGLPLSAYDAWRVKKETIPELSADQALDVPCVLGPDQFELRNPAWTQYVESIASSITGSSSAHLRLELLNLSLEGPLAIDLLSET